MKKLVILVPTSRLFESVAKSASNEEQFSKEEIAFIKEVRKQPIMTKIEINKPLENIKLLEQ